MIKICPSVVTQIAQTDGNRQCKSNIYVRVLFWACLTFIWEKLSCCSKDLAQTKQIRGRKIHEILLYILFIEFYKNKENIVQITRKSFSRIYKKMTMLSIGNLPSPHYRIAGYITFVFFLITFFLPLIYFSLIRFISRAFSNWSLFPVLFRPIDPLQSPVSPIYMSTFLSPSVLMTVRYMLLKPVCW